MRATLSLKFAMEGVASVARGYLKNLVTKQMVLKVTRKVSMGYL